MRKDASPLLVRFLRGSEAKLSRRAIAFPARVRVSWSADSEQAAGREGGGLFSGLRDCAAFRRAAQRTAAQRSAAQRSGLGPGFPAPGLSSSGGEVFLDLPCLFCLPEDVNNAQPGLSPLHLERLAPTRAPAPPAGFPDLMPFLAAAMGARWILAGALAVILAAPPGTHGWYFLCLKHVSGL